MRLEWVNAACWLRLGAVVLLTDAAWPTVHPLGVTDVVTGRDPGRNPADPSSHPTRPLDLTRHVTEPRLDSWTAAVRWLLGRNSAPIDSRVRPSSARSQVPNSDAPSSRSASCIEYSSPLQLLKFFVSYPYHRSLSTSLSNSLRLSTGLHTFDSADVHLLLNNNFITLSHLLPGLP